MALGVTDTSNEELQNSSPQVTALPTSFSMWVYPTTDLAAVAYLSFLSASSTDFIALAIAEGATPDAVQALCFNTGGVRSVNASSAISYNAWNHVGATYWNSGGPDTAMRVYHNGGNAVSSSPIGGTHSTWTQKVIGGPQFGGANFEGYMAEFGSWNVQLTDAEFAALGVGYSPLFIRPGNLKHYVRMFDKSGPSVDMVWSGTWSWSGTLSVQPHPPNIIYPDWIMYGKPGAAAGAERLPSGIFVPKQGRVPVHQLQL